MKILYVCNDLDYWRAHRAATAFAMAAVGNEVALLTGVPPGATGGLAADDAVEKAAAHNTTLAPIPVAEAIIPGGRVWTLPLQRLRLTPRADLRFARAIAAAVAAFRPDVVHLLTLKPALFGGLVLRRTGGQGPRVVATFAGLGRVFATERPDLRQRLVLRGLRLALGNPYAVAVFENEADRARLVSAGVIPASRAAVVSGAGFDPSAFPPAPMPPGPEPGSELAQGQKVAVRLECLFASRMLRAKGVEAVTGAARLLRDAGAPVRITLAGHGGDDPDAVPPAALSALQDQGLIRYLGAVPPSDMATLIAAHHVLLLPTRYPEGTPRILSEAGSVGRPAIVSAHPGCTTFVRDGVEGIVLARPDAPALAAAIEGLIDDPALLARLGAAARDRALGGFTTAAVAAAYRGLYRR